MFQRELRIDLEKLSFLRESLAPDDHFIPAQRQAPKSNSPVFVGLKHARYACRLANNSATSPDAPARRIGHLKPQLSAYPLRKRNGGHDTNCDQREKGIATKRHKIDRMFPIPFDLLCFLVLFCGHFSRRGDFDAPSIKLAGPG